jgi:hypothetical protein
MTDADGDLADLGDDWGPAWLVFDLAAHCSMSIETSIPCINLRCYSQIPLGKTLLDPKAGTWREGIPRYKSPAKFKGEPSIEYMNE